MCVIQPELNGHCMHPTHFEDPSEGFPGDRCEGDKDCHFGPRRCYDNVCEGARALANCGTSVDCTYGHYCSNGQCIPLKDIVHSYCLSCRVMNVGKIENVEDSACVI